MRPNAFLFESRWILALADDLTGALEVAACFEGAVVETQLITTMRPDAAVLVIDTETRHLSSEHASSVVREVVLAAQRFNPWLIYKKTDSTLRGNIAAEFKSLVNALSGRSLVYSPSYPKMGRSVKAGELFVHGIPVHQSAFASDTLNPVRTSSISALLNGVVAIIVDGESDADLEAAALNIVGQDFPPIAAGPTAFAGAIAMCLHPTRRPMAFLPRLDRCLVVNGSTHPVSLSQIEYARTLQCFDASWILYEGTFEGSGLRRAASTGEDIRRILEGSPFDGLVVFGGDTAFGIHQALGYSNFHSRGELVAGVPISLRGDLVWITKAGGFGELDLICGIRKRLT